MCHSTLLAGGGSTSTVSLQGAHQLRVHYAMLNVECEPSTERLCRQKKHKKKGKVGDQSTIDRGLFFFLFSLKVIDQRTNCVPSICFTAQIAP